MMPHGLFARMRSGENSSADADDGNVAMARMVKRAVAVMEGFILEGMFIGVAFWRLSERSKLMYYDRVRWR